MSAFQNTRCICCGQPVGDPPVLNRLSDGRSCPHCAERFMESLPPALPRRPEGVEQGSVESADRVESVALPAPPGPHPA